jgi:hypothetical protein
VMNRGQVALDGTPEEVFRRTEELGSLSLRTPQVTVLAQELGLSEKTILNVKDMVDWLENSFLEMPASPKEVHP